ncbi:uncharacterized protein DFL_003184 [Arthrobotrys flagrans]|uniref:Uncharacterized protein n=1 Tax=Arthrobotrys flagrans TaxID=97331 RepID=A0A437A1B4_ARTFL|nr:hypothetical protein DFL_003184 [Arthrobotrys flagrans]
MTITPPTSPWGYNASTDQIGRMQAREYEQITAGKVSAADVYYSGGVEGNQGGLGGSHVRKKQVEWDQWVVGGEGGRSTGLKNKMVSIGRAVSLRECDRLYEDKGRAVTDR